MDQEFRIKQLEQKVEDLELAIKMLMQKHSQTGIDYYQQTTFKNEMRINHMLHDFRVENDPEYLKNQLEEINNKHKPFVSREEGARLRRESD